jgi:DNA-binding MarR family transcriptional regulator
MAGPCLHDSHNHSSRNGFRPNHFLLKHRSTLTGWIIPPLDGMAAIDSHTLRQVDHWVFAWCSLIQRSRRWQADLDEALQPHHLLAAEFLVLWRTGQAAPPGISQVELARDLNVSAAHVCGIVEKLQERHWLQTTRPLQDRRRRYCLLTVLGSAALQRLIADLLPTANRCLLENASVWSGATNWTPIQEEAA